MPHKLTRKRSLRKHYSCSTYVLGSCPVCEGPALAASSTAQHWLSIIYQVEKSVILAHYTSIKKCPFFSEIMLMEGARQFAS